MKRRILLGTFLLSVLLSFPSNSTISSPPPPVSFSLSSPTRPLFLICVRIFALGACEKPNISGEIGFFPEEKLMDHFVFLTGVLQIVYVMRTNTSARTRVQAGGERTSGIVYAGAELIFMSFGLLFMRKYTFKLPEM